MVSLRRFLVLIPWIFWQGGFTFYTAIVVPIGTEVLGSALQQGLITRLVTRAMNGAGVVALVFLALELGVSADPRRWRRILCWLLLILVSLGQGSLFWLHGQLDAELDLETQEILHRPRFRLLHRIYLWTCTAQCGGGLVLLYLLLKGWRSEDQRLLSKKPWLEKNEAGN